MSAQQSSHHGGFCLLIIISAYRLKTEAESERYNALNSDNCLSSWAKPYFSGGRGQIPRHQKQCYFGSSWSVIFVRVYVRPICVKGFYGANSVIFFSKLRSISALLSTSTPHASTNILKRFFADRDAQ